MRTRRFTEGLTLAQLACYFPNKEQENFRAALPPVLCPKGAQPQRCDLTPWWPRVKSAISGLGAEIEPERLEDVHMRRLAPLIVGPDAWPTYAGKRATWSWVEFVQFIDCTFSLSREACIDAVYEMRQEKAETWEVFALRIDAYRERYGIDKASMFRHFKGLLSVADRRNMDAMVDNLAFAQGQAHVITWDNIINLAVHRTSTPRMAPTHPCPTVDPVPFAEVAPGVPTAKGVPAGASMAMTGGTEVKLPPAPTVPVLAVAGGHQAARSMAVGVPARREVARHDGEHAAFQPCELCSLCPSRRKHKDTHPTKFCHANPLNPQHRPVFARQRLAELRDLQLPIPDCMKAYAEANPVGVGAEQLLEGAVTEPQFRTFMADLQHLVQEGLDLPDAVVVGAQGARIPERLVADLLPAVATAPPTAPASHVPAGSAAAAAPPASAAAPPAAAPAHVGVVIEGRPKPPSAAVLQGVVGSGSASVDAGTVRQVMELILAQRGEEGLADSMVVADEDGVTVEGSSEDDSDDASAVESEPEPEQEQPAQKKKTKRRVRLQDSSAQTGGVGGKAVSSKPAADSVEAQA